METKRFILVALDCVALAAAFLISVLIRQSPVVAAGFGYIDLNIVDYALSLVIAAIMLVSVFSGFRLYQIREIQLSARIFTVLKALFTWAAIAAACVYAIKYDFSRIVLFSSVILTAIFICLARFFYFKYHQNKKKDDAGDVYIIGTGNRAKDIEKQIGNSLPKLSVVRLDYNDPSARSRLASLPGGEIFIADESMTREQVMEILADDSLKHHRFRVILDTFRLTTGEVQPNDIDEIPSISANYRPYPLYFAVKRAADIVLAGAGILITSPVWLAISVMIKRDSPGPVLIRQCRIGSHSKPFTLLKFRTMRCDTILYGLAPQGMNDPRITRIGRFLRRFSLDELPQLWNILKGDMSLVGPRPEMEFIVKGYQPWQRLRLRAKPGLTGLWQILGRKDIPLHENLEYDFYYVANRNLILDTSILLKTLPAVIFGRGAY